MKKKIGRLRKKMGKKILASTAGKAIGSFLENDWIYIITLAISGIVLMGSRFGIGKLLLDVYFDLFPIILAMTLVSYCFLRLVRNKKYSEKDNHGIMVMVIWIVAAFISWIVLMFVVLFIRDILKIFKVAIGFAVFYAFWYTISLVAAGLILWKLYLRENLPMGQFIMSIIDGLAWIITFGGIGALAILDVLYSVLLLLDYVGLLY